MSNEEKVVTVYDKIIDLEAVVGNINQRLIVIENVKQINDIKKEIAEAVVSEVLKTIRCNLSDKEKSKLGMC